MHRPGLLGIILGILIILAGIAGDAVLSWRAYQETPNDVSLLGPGRATILASQTGTYIVWNDYQTVFDGETYSDSTLLPSGWKFLVTDDATGQALALASSLNETRQINSSLSNSVGSVEISTPGSYTLIVTGTGSRRVFSIGYSPFEMLGHIFAAGLPISLAGMLLGVIILIWGIVRLAHPSNKHPVKH